MAGAAFIRMVRMEGLWGAIGEVEDSMAAVPTLR